MRARYAFLLVFDHCILALVPNGHFVQPHDVTLLAFHESPQLRTRTSKSILSFPTPLTNSGNPLFSLDLLGILSLDDREHAHSIILPVRFHWTNRCGFPQSNIPAS